MKAVTLYQPWASMLLAMPNTKTHETRSWAPPRSLVGQTLAIHAGKRPIDDESAELLHHVQLDGRALPDFPLGAIVGTARLTKVVRVDTIDTSLMGSILTVTVKDAYGSPQAKVTSLDVSGCSDWGDYGPGRVLWFVDQRRIFDEPISFRGRQGIWNWPESV